MFWNWCIGLIVIGVVAFVAYCHQIGKELTDREALQRARRIPKPDTPKARKLITAGILRGRATSLISAYEWGWNRLPGSKLPPDRRAEHGLPMLDTIEQILEFLRVESYSELVLLGDANALSAHGGFDPRTRIPNAPAKLQNYWPKRIPKRGGGERLLLVPKPKLKAVQRKILRGILDKIPPHPAARGFKKGRGLIDHVSPHTGQRVVMTWDIEQFFSVDPFRARASRVRSDRLLAESGAHSRVALHHAPDGEAHAVEALAPAGCADVARAFESRVSSARWQARWAREEIRREVHSVCG